ncbi:CapA family protein [Candidatus Kaiserbacteria bacterium]|nr:CapA family protein [Candidatus Kaiserbacteria bacterium]
MKYKLKKFFVGFFILTVWSVFLTSVDFSSKTLIPQESFGNFISRKSDVTERDFKIAFVGDILLARDVEISMLKHGADYPYRQLDKLHEYDYVVGNFEATIPTVHALTAPNSTTFSVQANVIPALREAGFTHLSLANNHSKDYGDTSFNNTVNVLENNNLVTFGSYDEINQNSVSYLLADNKVIALIGVHTFANGLDIEKFNEVMLKANKNSDLQIIVVHWGIEYEPIHRKIQREEAETFVQAGADLIIGHHPHVVQDIEYINDVPVFYSLGNFIFDQYFSEAVQTGLMVELIYNNKNGFEITLHPVTSIGSKNQPRLMNESEKESFLNNLFKKSSIQNDNNNISHNIYIKNNLATLE